MDYNESSILLDIYNNWDTVCDITNKHLNGELFYNQQQVLMMKRDPRDPRPLSSLEYDILSFAQKKEVNLTDIDKEEFFNKYF